MMTDDGAWREFDRLQQELSDVFGRWGRSRTAAEFPPINIWTKDDAAVLTLEKKLLTIEAHVEPAERSTHELAHREYQQGDFRRTFTISDAIDETGITATLTDGVLRLTLPKAEPAKPRTIAVNVA